MYDIIIGDIHGDADALEALFKKMGYVFHSKVWKHPERKAIFVGDYMERGLELLHPQLSKMDCNLSKMDCN